MISIPVFDWADVKLTQAYLAALPVNSGQNVHDVVYKLALASGVSIKWDEDGRAVLTGGWTHILRAKIVFEEYISNLEMHSTTTDLSSEQEKSAAVLTLNVQPKSAVLSCSSPEISRTAIRWHETSSLENQISADKPKDASLSQHKSQTERENEVYVNITLSALPFAGLHSQPVVQLSSVSQQTLQEGISTVVNDCDEYSLKSKELNVNTVSQVKHEEKYSEIKLGKNKYDGDSVEKESHETHSLEQQHILGPNGENESGQDCEHPEDPHQQSGMHTYCSKSSHMPQLTHNVNKDGKGKTGQDCESVRNSCNVRSETIEDHRESHIKHSSDCSEVLCDIEQLPGTRSESKCKYKSGSTTSCLTVQHIIDSDVCNRMCEANEITPSLVNGSVSSPSVNISQNYEISHLHKRQNEKRVNRHSKKKKNYEELAPFKFFCSLCSFKSKRESHYQRHFQLHNQVSQLFTCDKCNFSTIRLGHLRRHELSHSNSALSCNLCQYRTNNYKFLTRHKRIKHNTLKTSEAEEEIFHCLHCHYSTNRRHFLQRHLKVHGANKCSKIQLSYQCQQCSYKTSRKEHLERHTSNVHGGQRPFLCHRCGKAFKRQDALKQHSDTHITQAAVACPVCGKGCRSQAHLTQHLAVHSTVRSFLCELCGSAFKTRAVQRKHVLTIHQHPKAFFCHHCSRKFNTKYALRRHIKQHGVEKKRRSEDHLIGLGATESVAMQNVLGGSMKMLQTDTIFIQETTKKQLLDTSAAVVVQESTVPHDGEKVTMQLAENYDPDSLRVIPSHSFIQHSNETATALLYLTGSFTQY